MTYAVKTNFGRVVATAETREQADKIAWDMDGAAYDRGERGAFFEVVSA